MHIPHTIGGALGDSVGRELSPAAQAAALAALGLLFMGTNNRQVSILKRGAT